MSWKNGNRENKNNPRVTFVVLFLCGFGWKGVSTFTFKLILPMRSWWVSFQFFDTLKFQSTMSADRVALNFHSLSHFESFLFLFSWERKKRKQKWVTFRIREKGNKSNKDLDPKEKKNVLVCNWKLAYLSWILVFFPTRCFLSLFCDGSSPRCFLFLLLLRVLRGKRKKKKKMDRKWITVRIRGKENKYWY